MDSEVRIKRIVLNRLERCVVCHHQFHPDDISVISREREMWTMLVECTDCHARNFVAAVLNDGDPEEAQHALRRLSEQAVRGFKELQPPEIFTEEAQDIEAEAVSSSDVIDMYEFLKNFDGDFEALLKS
jgi:hypothetical protein